jgi:non-ribosomal peptide synthetase component F
VVIKHQSVITFVENFTQLFKLSDNVTLGNQAPLDYDGSVKEICLTLKNASTMHIIPKMLFGFPIRLFEYLDLKHVNTINWATSALRIIASHKALDAAKPSYINKVFFSGEVMPVKVLNYFRRHLPESIFVNLYGPTETTFNCSYHIVNKAYNEDEVLPIGRSFPNTEIIILDQDNLPVKYGEKGEICVRGTSLALGYYNNPDATKKAFVQNPLHNNFPDLIYRTGDLGKYNDLGELIFISRMDHQIKHMGYRIELGEIETAVNAIPFVDIGVCIYDDINEKIVLFYQANETNDRRIITHLKDRLPKHMIPNYLIHFAKLPLKSNLKIDRVKLREKYFNEIG